MLAGLKSGRFDIAFEGVLQDDGSVAYTSPISRMFPGIVYSGRDNLNVSGVQDRPSLVRFLIANPGLTFITGAGRAVFDAFAAEVAAGGGSVVEVDGVQHHIRRQKEFERAIADLGIELRSAYSLSYSPSSTEPGYHKIRIEVDVPGARVRSRPGYWLSGN